MDKKILILKNDRVGDFFHSLRNIEHLRSHFSEHVTDIYLSEINIRFASVLPKEKLNIIQVNYNLSFIEKFNLFLKLFRNDYEYVFILSPKNFYFFLPIIFRNTKFLGICVDNEKRKRPSIFLRKYLFKYEVNNRSKNIRKKPIYDMEKKLLENIIPTIRNQIPYNEITNINIIPKKIFVLNIAKTSSTFEILLAKISVKLTMLATNIPNNSKVKKLNALEIIKNQNVIPAETANALNFDDERSITSHKLNSSINILT